MKCDFTAWATRNDILCADGRTIKANAFKDDDGKKVPLVWNHNHKDVEATLGHAVLKNMKDGVFMYAFFNDSKEAKDAKLRVQHGDIDHVSIFANGLKYAGRSGEVIHGVIREVSLVLAAANPGAVIETVLQHSDDDVEDRGSSARIYTNCKLELYHSDDENEDEDENENKDEINNEEEELEHSDSNSDSDEKESEEKKDEEADDGETIEDVVNSMNEKQQKVFYGMLASVMDEKKSEEKEGEEKDMKHNAFEQTDNNVAVLSHSDEIAILNTAKSISCGSFKGALKSYIDNNDTLSHGVEEIEKLFPDYKDVNPGAPEILTNDHTWVDTVINGVSRSPISRIRTRQADVRNIETLRARGYKKGAKKSPMGNLKLVSRTTDPQTVYVKESFNRDDVVDITDFDVVSWIRNGVMIPNFKEEIAQAILLGDGREDGDADKISEDHIRPVWTDDELYTIHADVDIAAMRTKLQGTDTATYFGDNFVYAEAILETALTAREKYRGSGNMSFFCTPHMLNVMLLARDRNGHRLFSNKDDLRTALDVDSIETVEQFENRIRTVDGTKKKKLIGMFMNLKDYQVGSTKGGQMTSFDDFDIDFNQLKFLIETRLSGANKRVYSAIVLEEPVADSSVGTEDNA